MARTLEGPRPIGQGRRRPPVTPITAPVTNRESAEARNTYAGASSAGCAGLPVGFDSPKCAAASGVVVDVISGVQTGPGATALTRMPRSISSFERPFVKVTIAPFVEA